MTQHQATTSTPFASPSELAQRGPVVFALGTFDGIHLGHQDVLREMANLAKELHALAAVLFFDPSPKAVFAPDNAAALMTTDDKCAMMTRRYGADAVVKMPFDLQLAALSPAEFLQRHFFGINGLNTVGFVVGTDWRFGKRNSGDAPLLTELAAQYGAIVRAVPQRCSEDGVPVSSTRIRNAIATGNFSIAAQLLGRPFTISGHVIRGQHIAASKLACPTANIDGEGMQLPPYGVYAARTRLSEDSQAIDGIVYIGDAPTFRIDDARPIVELHLFDFNGDIYGRRISVEPVKFLRESRAFPSPEALREQINLDIAEARAVLARSC